MINLDDIRRHIVTALTSLPASLKYHSLNHTLDVEAQCVIIAYEEGVTDEQSLLELRIAALYHDYGFLYTYRGHEEKSCESAKEELPAFELDKKTIESICKIILATKIPQSPGNLLQKIICDADLDYLGRDDYFSINNNLRNEFLEYGIISGEAEWEKSKIAFLKSHMYFTKYSRLKRNPKKLSHLEHLLTVKNKENTFNDPIDYLNL